MPLSNADLARLAVCNREGHRWPPRAGCQPGDEHWCDYCGSYRWITPDGRACYETPEAPCR
jgi:hypothetical protein